jgi:ABC-type antimicrobial peptide transport system permease subunit
MAADWRRTLMNVAAVVPIVAAYLILVAIAGGLMDESRSVEEQNIVLLSPHALDPSSGRLDEDVLEIAALASGPDAAEISPMIFRPIRVEDRILQLRAAPQETWVGTHGLSLLGGSWPSGGDQVAITEGIAVATGWNVGSEVEIFGTTFDVVALVRAPGTKFASVWLDYDRADRLFEGQSGFQMVTLRPAPGVNVLELRDRLDAVAGSDYSVYFESDLTALQSARGGAAQSLAAVSTIVGVLALTFGGFNLAALMLTERKREIGIARALGFSPAAIRTVTLIRALLVAVLGFAIGALAAVLILGSTAETTIRSYVFEPQLPALAWGAGIGITIVMSAFGTWLALRRPIRSPVSVLLELR